MATLADWVEHAQPYMYRAPARATAGMTWRWRLRARLAGELVDLSSGVTAEAKVLDRPSGDVLVTLAVDLSTPGEIVLSASPSATAGLADPAGNRERRCCSYLLLTDTSGRKVQVWASRTSPFVIEPGA